MQTLNACIADPQNPQDELVNTMPGNILLTVRAYVYRMFLLVDSREALPVEEFPEVYEAVCSFGEFLTGARQYYGAEDRFRRLDDEIRAFDVDDEDAQVLEAKREFRQAWSENMLTAVKQHVVDVHGLIEGREALDTEDFLKVCEAASLLRFVLDDEKRYLEAAGRRTS